MIAIYWYIYIYAYILHILARHFPHYIMLYLYFPENIPIISDVPRNSRYMLRGASSSKTLAVWLAKICVTLGSLLQMGDLVHQTIGNQLYFYKLGILHRHIWKPQLGPKTKSLIIRGGYLWWEGLGEIPMRDATWCNSFKNGVKLCEDWIAWHNWICKQQTLIMYCNWLLTLVLWSRVEQRKLILAKKRTIKIRITKKNNSTGRVTRKNRKRIKGPDNPTSQLLPTSNKRKAKTAWGKQEREKRWWRIGVE